MPIGYRTIVFCILISVGARVQAGTVVQQQEVAPGTTQAKQQVTIYIDAGKLRVEGENPSSGKYVMIFDQSKQVTWMVDLAKGTYIEFTAAQVQGMGNQMQGMQAQMQQMQEQMANMPPDQRAMMEQMMKQQMGGMPGMGAPPQKTVREKAKGQKVGQFTCTRYEVLSDGQLTEELCAAPLSDLKLDPSAFETFKALAAFYEPLTRQIPRGTWSAPTGMDQVQGFPVQTISYANQQPSTEWRVVSAESKPVDAGLFSLPAGLKKTEMPQMPPMQRPGMGR